MIRGYFETIGNFKLPYVNAVVEFPGRTRRLSVHFLLDTGADRTVLAPAVLQDFGVRLAEQPRGLPASGIGGAVATRSVQVSITLGSITSHVEALVLELVATGEGFAFRGDGLPSLLGHDVLDRFALIIDPARDRLLLLEPHEAASLVVPGER